MTFNDVNSDKIKAYNEQQDALTKARKDYLAEAKSDVSASDRADIKRTLTPRLNKMTGDVNNLVSSITSLLDQVKSQAGGMGVGAIGGCAKRCYKWPFQRRICLAFTPYGPAQHGQGIGKQC